MITRALSVTEVNHFIKTMLDGNSVLKNLMVEGEISNLKFHSSGHVYFSLKAVLPALCSAIMCRI